MKTKKNKAKFIAAGIFIIILITLGIFLSMHFLKNEDLDDPYKELQALDYYELLSQDGEYFIYCYQIPCPYCENIEEDIIAFSEKNRLYVVNVKNYNDTRSRYDWDDHHLKYDLEVGQIDEYGEILFYDRYNENLDETIIDDNGDALRYSIVIADEEYVSNNNEKELGKVYAIISSPVIDYSVVENEEDFVVPAVPMLFKIRDGKIVEYYFDDYEIIAFLGIDKIPFDEQ